MNGDEKGRSSDDDDNLAATVGRICFSNNHNYFSAASIGAVPEYFKNLPSMETLDGLLWDKE